MKDSLQGHPDGLRVWNGPVHLVWNRLHSNSGTELYSLQTQWNSVTTTITVNCKPASQQVVDIWVDQPIKSHELLHKSAMKQWADWLGNWLLLTQLKPLFCVQITQPWLCTNTIHKYKKQNKTNSTASRTNSCRTVRCNLLNLTRKSFWLELQTSIVSHLNLAFRNVTASDTNVGVYSRPSF